MIILKGQVPHTTHSYTKHSHKKNKQKKKDSKRKLTVLNNGKPFVH